jgi:hypothetical protein
MIDNAFHSPDKATFGQAAFAISRCSVNCELGTLPYSQVKNGRISPGKMVPAALEGGPCSQVYGAYSGGVVRVRAVKQES